MAQQFLANTDMQGDNTIFDNMPDYRSSQPAPKPLQIFQVVTYDKATPIMVSCKVKTADHLQSVYGADKAGQQRYCPELTKEILQSVIAELSQSDPAAAEKAKGFIVEDNEPYVTGRSYLADFELSFTDESGKIHINSPGLQTDWGKPDVVAIAPIPCGGKPIAIWPPTCT